MAAAPPALDSVRGRGAAADLGSGDGDLKTTVGGFLLFAIDGAVRDRGEVLVTDPTCGERGGKDAIESMEGTTSGCDGAAGGRGGDEKRRMVPDWKAIRGRILGAGVIFRLAGRGWG